MQHKILAYITRRRNGVQQLLVFAQRDHPDAGVQVPAGTVEAGEPIEDALRREVEEESGLSGLGPARKLAELQEANWNQIRHVFQLDAPAGLPNAWTHVVRGDGEDRGMVFEFYWIELIDCIELAGAQHSWLGLLKGDPSE